MCRDCEYGDYRYMNNEREWWDDFSPRAVDCETAQRKYKEAYYEILDEIAHDNGLDSSEWGHDDYVMFAEIMEI